MSAKDLTKTVLFRDRVFIDQQELVNGATGRTAYGTYGISHSGSVVIVRPDGYVGTVAPLDNAEHLDQYFGAFMNH